MIEVATVVKIAEVSWRVVQVSRAVVEGRPSDVARVALAEGWSVEAFGRASFEVAGLNGPETVALRDSRGEIATWVSEAEKGIYDRAGLRAENVAGRECLVRDDIDWDQKDPWGQTNLERAESGRAPLDPEGRPYQLHHVQQKDDGQLAELTEDEHQGRENDRILHDKAGPSEIHRKKFDEEIRPDHWRARAEDVRSERMMEDMDPA